MYKVTGHHSYICIYYLHLMYIALRDRIVKINGSHSEFVWLQSECTSFITHHHTVHVATYLHSNHGANMCIVYLPLSLSLNVQIFTDYSFQHFPKDLPIILIFLIY